MPSKGSEKRNAADATSDSEQPPPKKAKKARAASIPWAKTPVFGERLVEYLTDNPTQRAHILGDSNEAAKEEGRKKKTGKDGKEVAFGAVAKYIFDRDTTAEECKWQAKYLANTTDFVQSTIQFWARTKSTYGGHAKSLKQTGGGIMVGEDYDNQLEKIRDKFPLWDDLHPMLCSIPSIVPPGISNSEHGQDHSGAAANLFASGKTSQASSMAGDSKDNKEAEEDEDDGEDTTKTSDINDEYVENMTSPIDLDNDEDEEQSEGFEMEKKGSESETEKDARSNAVAGHKHKTKGKAKTQKSDGKADKRSKKKKDQPRGAHAGDFDIDGLDSMYASEIKDASKRAGLKMELELKKLDLQILQQKAKDKQRAREDERDRRAREQQTQVMGLMGSFMERFG